LFFPLLHEILRNLYVCICVLRLNVCIFYNPTESELVLDMN
jgi:hypothetical protein